MNGLLAKRYDMDDMLLIKAGVFNSFIFTGCQQTISSNG